MCCLLTTAVNPEQLEDDHTDDAQHNQSHIYNAEQPPATIEQYVYDIVEAPVVSSAMFYGARKRLLSTVDETHPIDSAKQISLQDIISD